jgi:hypothetical protein
MHQTHAFYIVLAIVFTGFGLHLCYQTQNENNWREGFALSPASYAVVSDRSDDMSSDRSFPVFDSGYAQYINQNNALNKVKRTPLAISLNSEVRRVNFYGSEPMTCPDVPKPDVANCLYYGRKTNSLYKPT